MKLQALGQDPKMQISCVDLIGHTSGTIHMRVSSGRARMFHADREEGAEEGLPGVTSDGDPQVHPSATSSIIITAKPARVVMVTMSMFAGVRCDSGISSSTTTKIIAPAAKQRA